MPSLVRARLSSSRTYAKGPTRRVTAWDWRCNHFPPSPTPAGWPQGAKGSWKGFVGGALPVILGVRGQETQALLLFALQPGRSHRHRSARPPPALVQPSGPTRPSAMFYFHCPPQLEGE